MSSTHVVKKILHPRIILSAEELKRAVAVFEILVNVERHMKRRTVVQRCQTKRTQKGSRPKKRLTKYKNKAQE